MWRWIWQWLSDMTNKAINILALAFGIAWAGVSAAAEFSDVLWLSETAPPKAKAAEGGAQPALHEHHHTGHDMSMMSASAPVAASAVADGKKHKHDEQISPDGDTPGKDHRPASRCGCAGVTASGRILCGFGRYQRAPDDGDLGGKKTQVTSNTENGRMTLKTNTRGRVHETYLESAVRDGKLLRRPRSSCVGFLFRQGGG
jgi:hypothetical protein